MNHRLRASLLSLVALVASPVLTVALRADPMPFPTTSVTVGGTIYDLTYVLADSFNSVAPQLESQAWWGNQALADSLALAVGTNLADYNFNNQSPYFAYSIGNGDFNGAFTFNFSPNSNVQIMTAPIDGWAGRWAVAIPESSVPDDPSTLGLTLLAVTALGIASWRRRRASA